MSDLPETRERNADDVGEMTNVKTKGVQQKKRKQGAGHACKGVIIMMFHEIYSGLENREVRMCEVHEGL